MTAAWPGEVLAFWFEELTPAAWFRKDEALDRDIRSRFLVLHEQVSGDFRLEREVSTADRAVAAAILLDQLPRNMFRNSPKSFASDEMALAVAKRAVDLGLDASIEPQRRTFLYLPFEHSELLADQDRSVELFSRLADPELLRYAVSHRDIIARFGRFPHRNAILGRASTREEIEFLQTPGSSF